MEFVEKAIETTATINAQRQLILDEPLPVTGPIRVRVIMLLSEKADIDEKNGFEPQVPILPSIF